MQLTIIFITDYFGIYFLMDWSGPCGDIDVRYRSVDALQSLHSKHIENWFGCNPLNLSANIQIEKKMKYVPVCETLNSHNHMYVVNRILK